MSPNVRVVLVLLVLVGGATFFAFYSTQEPPVVPEGPTVSGEGDAVEPPPVPIGRPVNSAISRAARPSRWCNENTTRSFAGNRLIQLMAISWPLRAASGLCSSTGS